MGTFVDQVSDNPFDWGTPAYTGTSQVSVNLVQQAFEESLIEAREMMIRLVGEDGTSGALGGLLASIDTVTAPSDITAALQWVESVHDTTLYTLLINRLTTDLQAGATGLDPTVEAEIFARALARQNIEEDKAQTEIEEYFSSRGFDLPPLAMAARLQEHLNARTMRTADLNGKILVEQAELAQKNSQFAIGIAEKLEGTLRVYTDKRNDRNLDFAKAFAANVIAIYAASVDGYKAEAEMKAKIAEAMANIAMQSIASARGSIHANAGISHGSGRSESESFTHTENRSIGWDVSNTLNELHPFEPKANP